MLANSSDTISKAINHPLQDSELLAIANLLQGFEEGISQLLSYDSFEYICEALGQHVIVGWPGDHTANYSLNLSGLNLGQLSLTRTTPFRESELSLVENALPMLLRQISDISSAMLA